MQKIFTAGFTTATTRGMLHETKNLAPISKGKEEVKKNTDELSTLNDNLNTMIRNGVPMLMQ